MAHQSFIYVHIPGQGTLTLSWAALERALIAGRLPENTEAWHGGIGLWVALGHHPDVQAVVQMAGLPDLPVPRAEPLVDPEFEPVVDLDFDLVEADQFEVTTASGSGKLEGSPIDLPLIPLEDLEPHREFSQFLQRSSAAEERRRAVRDSGGVRPDGPSWVFVASAAEIRKGQRQVLRFFTRYPVVGWAALLALVLLGGTGFFVFGRIAGGQPAANVPGSITNALSAAGRGPVDSVPVPAVLEAPNPLATAESELIANLQISEALFWQPESDFSGREQLARSARKIDAVGNSISFYRIAAWRLIDSAYRDSDPRLEPYEEISRINDVLSLMRTTVVLLDSLVPHFKVSGKTLVFDTPDAADRYRWLRNRVDSLFHSPVEGDSLRLLRAPRRAVARLLKTLPAATAPVDKP
jgi:hypothetical protein